MILSFANRESWRAPQEEEGSLPYLGVNYIPNVVQPISETFSPSPAKTHHPLTMNALSFFLKPLAPTILLSLSMNLTTVWAPTVFVFLWLAYST